MKAFMLFILHDPQSDSIFMPEVCYGIDQLFDLSCKEKETLWFGLLVFKRLDLPQTEIENEICLAKKKKLFDLAD